MSEDKITLKIDSVDKLTEHWIAEGERIATERIIKLLETEFCEPEFNGDSFTPADNLLVNLGLAIALIKGEK